MLFGRAPPGSPVSQEPRLTRRSGGTLVYDAEAPAFWVLAGTAGNEAWNTTWPGREGPS